jgi:aminoglycoside phosphotransferase (APT) family kinase protein
MDRPGRHGLWCDDERVSPEEIVSIVNVRLASDFALDGFLGGIGTGAWRLADRAGGRRAVLKLSTPTSGFLRSVVEGLPALTEHLRQRDYPTPPILAAGAVADGGTWFWVQAWSAGEPMERALGEPLSPGNLERLLATLNLHEAIAPAGHVRDWSAFVHDNVLAGDHEWGVLAGVDDDGVRGALAALSDWLRPVDGVRLEDTDFVHGDFGPHNTIVDGPTLAVIDLDSAGRGDRMIDLARLLRHGLGDPPIARRIIEKADAANARDRLRLAAAYWSVNRCARPISSAPALSCAARSTRATTRSRCSRRPRTRQAATRPSWSQQRVPTSPSGGSHEAIREGCNVGELLLDFGQRLVGSSIPCTGRAARPDPVDRHMAAVLSGQASAAE